MLLCKAEEKKQKSLLRSISFDTKCTKKKKNMYSSVQEEMVLAPKFEPGEIINNKME